MPVANWSAIPWADRGCHNPGRGHPDEATANIDGETEERIQRALETLLEGRTAVVIAHRLSTIKRADTIVVLHKGRVKEQGTHDELLAAQGLYWKLYRLQSEEAVRGVGSRNLQPSPVTDAASATTSPISPLVIGFAGSSPELRRT